MKESKIEENLKGMVEKMGGLCLKLWPVSLAGIPDRIVLLPSARIWFVELKAPGKTPRRLQYYWFKVLRNLGFKVVMVNSMETLNAFNLEMKSE